jgi:hypothetical protein
MTTTSADLADLHDTLIRIRRDVRHTIPPVWLLMVAGLALVTYSILRMVTQ